MRNYIPTVYVDVITYQYSKFIIGLANPCW